MWKAAVEYRKGRDNGLLASEEARKREAERFTEERAEYDDDRREWDVERGKYQAVIDEARTAVVELNGKIDTLLQQHREELRKLRELHQVEVDGWHLRREMDLATIHALREYVVQATGRPAPALPPSMDTQNPPNEGSDQS